MAKLLCLMALTSCATLSGGNKPEIPQITSTEVVTETVTLPGKVSVVPIEAPDTATMADCGGLTDEFIPGGDDISGADAVRTAAKWGKTANDCRDTNILLRGWIMGVVAATKQD